MDVLWFLELGRSDARKCTRLVTSKSSKKLIACLYLNVPEWYVKKIYIFVVFYYERKQYYDIIDERITVICTLMVQWQ